MFNYVVEIYIGILAVTAGLCALDSHEYPRSISISTENNIRPI